MEKSPVDPALTEHLAELAELANQVGAEGVWLFRGTKDAYLTYTPIDAISVRGSVLQVNLTLRFDIADAGVLVVMRFPASDGKEPGIELK